MNKFAFYSGNLYIRAILLYSLMVLASCKTQRAEYAISQLDKDSCLYLKTWNILGPVKSGDTTCKAFLANDHLLPSGISEASFCKDPFHYRIKLPKRFIDKNVFCNSIYTSNKPIIDFNNIHNEEHFSIKNNKGSAIYFYCQLNAVKDETIFLLTRSSNGIKVWLNGEPLYNSHEGKGFELAYSEYISLKIKKGNNNLLIKKVNLTNDIFFEGILCRKRFAIKEYVKKSSCLLLQNPIVKDTIWLLANHAKDMDTSIEYKIIDMDGKSIFQKRLSATDKDYFLTPILKSGHAYQCMFTLLDHTFTQPFCVGNPDSVYQVFVKKKTRYIANKEAVMQINVYLYRLKFLLDHSSRHDDWWWKFKASDILFELCNMFNNLENNHPLENHSFGIQLKTYISDLDNNVQHYLLITPDDFTLSKKYPLVVVIRPNIESNHHFLTSPQISRYWSLSYSKYLANKYNYVIMMPEARLYLDEPLIPMAEKEILNAIEDVEKCCRIDTNRMYLHGNCSAGYRCLALACHFPDKFAAIGLYAPLYKIYASNEWIYKNSPECFVKNLSLTPIMVHYDPEDTHSPYSFFGSLIDDCRKYQIPVKVTSEVLSGVYYNVVLAGEEAFAFFKNKTRTVKPKTINLTFYNNIHNKAWWLSATSVKKNKISKICAHYDDQKDVIRISGENVSTLHIDLKMLDIDKQQALTVSYNGKQLFKGMDDKKELSLTIEPSSDTTNTKIIADLFAGPYLFVYNKKNNVLNYKKVVDSLKNEYEKYLFTGFPLKSDDELAIKDLDKNLFIIGHTFNNGPIDRLIKKLLLIVAKDKVVIDYQSFVGDSLIFQAIFDNPVNPKRKIVIYSANNYKNFEHKINYPWKSCLEKRIVIED
jgi:hypothetical protein